MTYCDPAFSKDKLIATSLKGLFVGLLLTTASTASAVSVSSLSGGTSIPIPGLNLSTTLSDAIGGGITFSSNVPVGSVLGATGTTEFGNGSFGPGNPYLFLGVAANGYSYATMSLTFSIPTSGFLADIRWTDGGPEIGNMGFNSASLAAYNSAGELLEFIPFNNNGFPGGRVGFPSPGFFGFLRSTADIARIDFNNAYMGARDLQYIGPAIGAGTVPEPASWLMMFSGFGLLGATLRQRKPAKDQGLAAVSA